MKNLHRIVHRIIAVLATLILFAGCVPQAHHEHVHKKHHKLKKKQYSQVYQTDDGRHYARSHVDDDFWFWMYVTDSGSSSSSNSATWDSGGSWTRVSSSNVPIRLTPTSQVVSVNTYGRPTQEVKELFVIPVGL